MSVPQPTWMLISVVHCNR